MTSQLYEQWLEYPGFKTSEIVGTKSNQRTDTKIAYILVPLTFPIVQIIEEKIMIFIFLPLTAPRSKLII
jgi:hypothetical protein